MNNKFSQMKKNTVDAENQLRKSQFVTYINSDGRGKRIMFLGNSITLHGIKEDIGWNNEWGMAASSEDNDYVHRMISMIDEILKDCAYCICQVAAWESDYKNGSSLHKLFEAARDFSADVIIMRFAENCPGNEFDGEVFKEEMESLFSYLDSNKKAKIIMSTPFWHHPADKAIIEYANENKLPIVELSDLGEQDEMKAIGLFEHSGVANHPGDLGMKKIAERLFEEVKNVLQQYRGEKT